MDNLWRYCIGYIRGGIVVAETEEEAKDKIMEYYQGQVYEPDLIIWKAEEDDDYNYEVPGCLECY